MKRVWPLLFLLFVVLGAGVWKWRAARFDVDVSGGDVALDTLNNGLPMLATQLKKHPGANTFRVVYRVVPDSTQPGVFLPRRLEYNRAQKRLDWHRDTLWIDRYDTLSEAAILRVAGEHGGIRKLIRSGAKRSLPPESKTFDF